mmetsp:Transcript_15524/g.37930  ORF Transcript_15524/g.37930 Transcript_15524/m.37930 type:complete len:129 (-) Transcript_15524:146-532(-)
MQCRRLAVNDAMLPACCGIVMDMAFSNGTQQTHGIINVCSTLEYTGNSVVCPISGAVDSHCHMSLGFIQCALQHHNAHTLASARFSHVTIHDLLETYDPLHEPFKHPTRGFTGFGHAWPRSTGCPLVR